MPMHRNHPVLLVPQSYRLLCPVSEWLPSFEMHPPIPYSLVTSLRNSSLAPEDHSLDRWYWCLLPNLYSPLGKTSCWEWRSVETKNVWTFCGSGRHPHQFLFGQGRNSQYQYAAGDLWNLCESFSNGFCSEEERLKRTCIRNSQLVSRRFFSSAIGGQKIHLSRQLKREETEQTFYRLKRISCALFLQPMWWSTTSLGSKATVECLVLLSFLVSSLQSHQSTLQWWKSRSALIFHILFCPIKMLHSYDLFENGYGQYIQQSNRLIGVNTQIQLNKSHQPDRLPQSTWLVSSLHKTVCRLHLVQFQSTLFKYDWRDDQHSTATTWNLKKTAVLSTHSNFVVFSSLLSILGVLPGISDSHFPGTPPKVKTIHRLGVKSWRKNKQRGRLKAWVPE